MIVTNAVRIPTAADARLDCARLPFIARHDRASLAAAAQALGMACIRADTYKSPRDGSFVFMDAQGLLQRGEATTLFQGIPQGMPAAAAAAPPRAPAWPTPPPPVMNTMGPPVDNSRPGVPASMVDMAIAKIGIVDVDHIAARAPYFGFVQSGTDWVHQDGSWIRVVNRTMSVGWKGYSLVELPYVRAKGGWQ